MTTPANENNEDQTSNISRASSVHVSSLSDDPYNCCFNCDWNDQETTCQQHEEAYVPTGSVYAPEVITPLTQVPESVTESQEASESAKELCQVSKVIPEVHVIPPTPSSSPKLRQRRRNQIYIEQSLDESHYQVSPQNIPSEDVPSLLQIHQNKKPCTCMVQMNPHILSNVPPYRSTSRQTSSISNPRSSICRTLNPQALQNSRGYHLHMPPDVPPDDNCVVLSGLPLWPANIVYGWLIYICSHHHGFREVYMCNSNLAYVEFSSEIFARDACAHLNGLRLPQRYVLRATHSLSQFDMPPPHAGSEKLI